MPRFLTREWAAAFDAALAGVELPGPGEDAGLAAADGRFTVVQEVQGGPGGGAVVVLTADAGTLHLTLGDPGVDPGGDVTIALAYEDAVALSRGELAAAEALTEGRIRVRGDLSVLVAGQQMLAAAQPYVQALAAETTY